MIVLKNSEEDKFPFQFGLKKAKLILENIESIKKFVWAEFAVRLDTFIMCDFEVRSVSMNL